MEELKACWNALNPADTAHRVLHLIIAMGGLRVTEICRSRQDWWTDDGWLLLPETKNGQPPTVPLPQSALRGLAIARTMAAPHTPWLFPNKNTPDEPITLNGVRQSVRRLYNHLDMAPFNPRDLRRTLKTHLIDRQTDERWLEIWHNHGQTAGVARKHYTRSEHQNVKIATAKAIDAFIDDVLGPGRF